MDTNELQIIAAIDINDTSTKIMYERVHQLHLDETVPLYAMFG